MDDHQLRTGAPGGVVDVAADNCQRSSARL